MATQDMQKITVMLPRELVLRALKSSGQGLTPTIRTGLEKVVAAEAYERLLQTRGKIRYPKNFLRDLRRD